MSSSATACQQSRFRIAVMSDSNQTDCNSWNSQEINLTLHQAVQMRHLLLTTNVITILKSSFVVVTIRIYFQGLTHMHDT